VRLENACSGVTAKSPGQTVSGAAGARFPVELRPARRHHVRDLQVAEPPAGGLADRSP
jgi:hypothetical protein